MTSVAGTAVSSVPPSPFIYAPGRLGRPLRGSRLSLGLVTAYVSLVAVLVACGTTAPTRSPTAPPAGFDIARVIANFTDECGDPFVVDELFCQQVQIARMTADGTILNVPTTLNSASDARAEAICNMLAVAHFDSEGQDLGYETIGILDQDGGNAAACFTR